MNTDVILRLLENAGFRILGTDGAVLYLEDPSCILRSFSTFIEYAWIVIVCITGVLLFGWAISLIRGAKNDIFINLRNLTIMFGTLAAVIPIVNMIWGDDLFARGCRTITVSINEINKVLDARNLKLADFDENSLLYENIYIYDSAAPHTLSYADAPIMTPDVPPDINVGLIGGHGMLQNSTSYIPTDVPIQAHANGNDVVYTNSDGTQYRRVGGTRAWRNTNPGNIRYSEFSRRMGAIGQAGGFAVFPDEETGMNAISALLRSNSYNNLTIAGAISRYAPPSENDTAAYHRRIQELTGLSINRLMRDLSDGELARVVSAIRTIEGWAPGQIVAY